MVDEESQKQQTDAEEETEPLNEEASLWPKTMQECFQLFLDLGKMASGMEKCITYGVHSFAHKTPFLPGAIGLIMVAIYSECPAIPGWYGFVLSFGILSVVAGCFKFLFSLGRTENQEKYARAYIISQLVGVVQLGLGAWGMVLIFPNLKYFGDVSPETCQIGPLLAMLIPSIIFAVLLVVLIGMGVYSAWKKK